MSASTSHGRLLASFDWLTDFKEAIDGGVPPGTSHRLRVCALNAEAHLWVDFGVIAERPLVAAAEMRAI
jgi:hypothetical protein